MCSVHPNVDLARYLIVGLQWIGSVLKNWWEELRESGLSGSPKLSFDK